MQPWFTAYIFDIGHPGYGQLTPIKTSTGFRLDRRLKLSQRLKTVGHRWRESEKPKLITVVSDRIFV